MEYFDNSHYDRIDCESCAAFNYRYGPLGKGLCQEFWLFGSQRLKCSEMEGEWHLLSE